MKLLSWLMAVLLCLQLVSCEYEEVSREVGYKGKARLNPWLAAEKFVKKYDRPVISTIGWKKPSYNDAVWIMPAAVLSNKSYIEQVENWMLEGGHLILIVENATPGDDWRGGGSEVPLLEEPFRQMLKRGGLKLEETGGITASEIWFQGLKYKTSANSTSRVIDGRKPPDVFASKKVGSGRLTVLTDGRILRNRWISDFDHPALLKDLIEAANPYGNIGFMRGTGLSLWGLILQHLWPVLIGLAVLIALWLWRSFSRFGPIEPAHAISELRGFDHHLEALGDFQWRVDKAQSLLAPIREQIVERGQRFSAQIGRRDDDFFQVLADRAGISRERVQRALTEEKPADSAILTRTTADLQRLTQIL